MSKCYDLCVVGTGPSSFFLVKKFLLLNPKSKVLVLEAGLKKFDNLSSLSGRNSIGVDFKLSPTINIGFGGTSQLWHNVLAPLDEEDFQGHSWIPNSGWPITFKDLEPHYEEVAKFFGFPYEIFKKPHKFCNFLEEKKSITFDSNIFDHKVFIHPSKYLRTSNSFNSLQKSYPNLEISKGVIALKFESSKGKNILVAFERKSGKSLKISSKKYVLCCGALNNPEILFNSDHIRKALPQIGNFLMDHPMGNFFQYKYEKPKTAKIYSGIKVKQGISMKIALKLNYRLKEKYGLANSSFYLRPSFSEGFNNHSEDLKNKLLTVRSKLKKFKFPFSEGIALMKDINIVAQIIQYKTGLLSKHSLTECMFVTEQRPSSLSKVFLTEKKNEFGNLKTEVNWQLSQDDINEVMNLKKFIDQNIMIDNRGSSTYQASSNQWKNRLASAAHHLGTLRMSKDANTGCVDRNLKLHGFQDIFVCDGSVFPTSGNANPTMTCMASR